MNLEQMVEALTSPPLSPTTKKETTMKLFNADGEVRVGDILRFNGKPCYIEKIGELVGITMLDERKTYYSVKPSQLNCVIQKDAR